MTERREVNLFGEAHLMHVKRMRRQMERERSAAVEVAAERKARKLDSTPRKQPLAELLRKIRTGEIKPGSAASSETTERSIREMLEAMSEPEGESSDEQIGKAE